MGVDQGSEVRCVSVAHRRHGDATPSLTYVVGGLGLVNNDALSGSLATTASATSNVGHYAITQGSLAASSNYTVSYTGADDVITARAAPPRPVILVANSENQVPVSTDAKIGLAATSLIKALCSVGFSPDLCLKWSMSPQLKRTYPQFGDDSLTDVPRLKGPVTVSSVQRVAPRAMGGW